MKLTDDGCRGGVCIVSAAGTVDVSPAGSLTAGHRGRWRMVMMVMMVMMMAMMLMAVVVVLLLLVLVLLLLAQRLELLLEQLLLQQLLLLGGMVELLVLLLVQMVVMELRVGVRTAGGRLVDGQQQPRLGRVAAGAELARLDALRRRLQQIGGGQLVEGSTLRLDRCRC